MQVLCPAAFIIAFAAFPAYEKPMAALLPLFGVSLAVEVTSPSPAFYFFLLFSVVSLLALRVVRERAIRRILTAVNLLILALAVIVVFSPWAGLQSLLCLFFALLLLAAWYLAAVVSLFLHRRRVAAIAMVVFPFFLLAVVVGGSIYRFHREREEFMGRVFGMDRLDLGQPLFSYDSPRSFTGDGYSFSVYPLPDSLRRRFVSDDKSLLVCPALEALMPDAEIVHWTATSQSAVSSSLVDFLFLMTEEDREKIPVRWRDDLRASLNRPGAWYSFYHRRGALNWVKFFLVEPSAGRIYLVYNKI